MGNFISILNIPDAKTLRPIAGHKTMTGCRRIVSIPIEGGSDGLLLLLNDKIPAEYNVYFKRLGQK